MPATVVALLQNDAPKPDPLADRIRCEVSTRAKRISIRIDVMEGCAVLVRPKRATDAAVGAFLHKQRFWIEKHLAQLPDRAVVGDGAQLDLLGRSYTLHAVPDAKRGVWKDQATIHVSGSPDHMVRRVRDFIKDEAKAAFTVWARDYAARLGVNVARVGVRDTTTRWGSCTKVGHLSLSWRLALAPEAVARYVVAHEVSHLRHMNHSPAFWRTVESICPGMKNAREWLRRNGASLYRML
jgi:predicted metal-dependent hydrolase